jgi:aldose 1-epimerase
MTPVSSLLIPTGELRPVKGTPFDFTTPVAIGARIQQEDEQLKFGNGYDHNFVINKRKGALALAATVRDPVTGRVLEALTTEPAIQFYCGNFLDGSLTGKGGRVYKQRGGFCLEPQHYPDSPNQPTFPTTTLKAGKKFKSTIMYRFSAK